MIDIQLGGSLVWILLFIWDFGNTVHSESRCSLRLWQSPVEMWWHMVTHRRGISGLWTSLLTPFISAQWLSELPLLCVTVCYHISTGLYHSIRAQRLSKRTVFVHVFGKPLLTAVQGHRKRWTGFETAIT